MVVGRRLSFWQGNFSGGERPLVLGEGKTSGKLGVAIPPPSENLGSFGVVPLPRIPVTTSTIIFLGLGDPCKPSFAIVNGREDNPRDPVH